MILPVNSNSEEAEVGVPRAVCLQHLKTRNAVPFPVFRQYHSQELVVLWAALLISHFSVHLLSARAPCLLTPFQLNTAEK